MSYKELGYIQADGSQYIDLGFRLNQDHKVDIKFMVSGDSAVFGSRNHANSNNIAIAHNSGNVVIDFNNGNCEAYRIVQAISGNAVYRVVSSKDGRHIYNANGDLLASSTTVCSHTITTPGNAYLFNMAYNANGWGRATGRIYYCKIYELNILTHDLIPVLDEDGVACLYDKVSGTYFRNAGTGNFTAGGYGAAEFGYSGDIQEFTAPHPGKYKIELWGAQGGSYSSYRGGYGGYSVGYVHLKRGERLYIAVGGAGAAASSRGTAPGGYNGGGMCRHAGVYCCGSGGGATHIAKVPGLLSDLGNNVDDIIMVAGGGAGCFYYNGFSGRSYGNSGGGYHGGYSYDQSMAGTQSSGYAFGKSDVDGSTFDSNTNFAGGGGGLYGGHSRWGEVGAGGGSGYIGFAGLSDAHMVGWNVPESAESAILTKSTTSYAEIPSPERAKVGGGYAIITLLSAEIYSQSGTAVFAFPINRITSALGSSLHWSANAPEGTSVAVFARLSGGEYAECKNGGAIPGIDAGDDLTGSALEIKVDMATEDDSVTPSLSDMMITITDAGDDRVLVLMLDSGSTTSIQNAVGDVAVSYGGGSLMGLGGAVAPFEMGFAPEGLSSKNNPHDAEHIEINIRAVGTLARVTYRDAAAPGEHIELSGISAVGALTHVNDI